MNPSQPLEIARAVLAWAGPLVAGGALARLGDSATDQAAQLAGRVWQRVQTWLASNPDAADDFRKLERDAEDRDRQQIVAKAVAKIAAADPAIVEELAALQREMQALGGGASGGTRTQIIRDNAQVGQAIVGDVHGGITLGPIDFSRNKRDVRVESARSTAQPTRTPAGPRQHISDPTLSADGVHFSFGHALLIGIGSYANAALSAPTTATDARDLGALLRDPAVAAYPDAQVQVLTDARATKACILQALDQLAARVAAAPTPTVLIFYAGHGEQLPGGYALLPHDYRAADAANTAISADAFHEKITAIRAHAKKLVVLLNCCHAGGVGDGVLGPGGAGGGDAPPPDFYQPLVSGSGQVVISSSRPEQKSGAVSQHDAAHTTFGAHLLGGLRGQASGAGPGIGIFELFSYLRTHVPADAATIVHQGTPLVQEPLFYAHQLDDNVAVALRPGGPGGTLDGSLATAIAQLVESEATLARHADLADAPATVVQQRDAALRALDD